MFARKATIEYHAPARFDEMLNIGVRCAELGRTSLRFVLEIYRNDELLISGEMLYVHADSRIRKSEPVPAIWRDTLTAFEKGLAIKI
jgi:acyl-CoA thioester hydrolase